MNAPVSIPVRVVFITPEETLLSIEAAVEREHARQHLAAMSPERRAQLEGEWQ